jgi:hypothetical protein
MAHVLKKCGCPLCVQSRKIRRQNNALVIGGILAFVLVVAVSLFASRSAECHPPGNCWGFCTVGTTCGTGPGCGCVPRFPDSPTGVCVGG